jgi:V-type H+-transporting ATPase subunit C
MYIVAAKLKDLDDNGIESAIKRAPSFSDHRPGEKPTTHKFVVEKTSFKVGSIDTLMQLNEQTSKIDSKIENICRKIETTARSGPNTSALKYKLPDEKEVTYKEYIQNFSWNTAKYSQNKSLTELFEVIEKNVATKETLIKGKENLVNQTKQKLAKYAKKEGTSYMQKDFRDDLYAKEA